MVSTFVEQVRAMPLNSAVMAINTVIWFWMWNTRVGFDEVATSYRKVVTERQYYRIVTATFTHLNVLHLVFNMATLYSVGEVEAALGPYYYLVNTLLLIVASEAVWMALTYVLVRFLAQPQAAEAQAVGYSGVLFGWMALLSVLTPDAVVAFMGFPVAMWLSPWVSLGVTQLIMPRASFLGHLSGIFAGYAIGAGAFAWLSGYWLWTGLAYGALLCLLSLKANAGAAGGGVGVAGAWVARCVTVSPAFVAHTGLGAPVAEVGAAAAAGGGGVRRYMDRGGILRVERALADGDVEIAPDTAAAPGAGSGGGALQGAGATVAAALAVVNTGSSSGGSSSSGGTGSGRWGLVQAAAARAASAWHYLRNGGSTRAYSRLPPEDVADTAAAARAEEDVVAIAISPSHLPSPPPPPTAPAVTARQPRPSAAAAAAATVRGSSSATPRVTAVAAPDAAVMDDDEEFEGDGGSDSQHFLRDDLGPSPTKAGRSSGSAC